MSDITIGEVGEAMRHARLPRYFAVRGDGDDFAFGASPAQALARFEARDAALANQFTLGMAQECAFMALGAMEVISERAFPGLEAFGGQVGFISEVVRHAPLVAQAWNRVGDDYRGVWLYEVSEQFGREWAVILLDGSRESASERLRKVIEEEMGKRQ